ncbi:YdcF family protein [Enterococcus rivorum]|uniref:DUF218 domain-containing protein n=1 Tax=Enterococcus rivorum TaxID=762845 RepID=A0A1E5L0A5_9ENTE|nr:YdcF family protein [Enterococcus rivorum]MBP2099169.1 hypothetical protein [Enterococcus rivorum]OEH83504.1 hypothetical protein BCR26_09370 [Enterococcus rivorum]
MIQDWNAMIEFLADQEEVDRRYDLAILAGNCLPYLADEMAKIYQEKRAKKLMLVGGIGHATKHLKRNFQERGFSYGDISETQMYLEYLEEKYAIPKTVFLTEHRSTNSGENAAFSLKIVNEARSLGKKVLLLEDPILQKRIKATFKKEWAKTSAVFTNYVPAIPYVKEVDREIIFEDSRFNGLWEKDYFFSLVLGEMFRLQDNESGYGPKGTGYIDEVVIPESVNKAYERVSDEYNYSNQRN